MVPHKVKKKVRFANLKSPMTRTQLASKTAKNCANTALYYLSKFKDLFYLPKTTETASSHQATSPATAQHIHQFERYPCGESDQRQNACEVVNTAIACGRANDIIEESGYYFRFKESPAKKLADRRPTPGPDYVRCSNCKTLIKNRQKRDLSNNEGRLKSHSRKSDQHRVYDDDFKRPRNRKRNNTNTLKIKNCSKCCDKKKAKRNY